ncbi:hypothetical protein Tsubulata_036887 [Turnera subulata]|uniref:Agenet domain-containing protein n=1 Tax=Turnera subulata TaxID=218843 RepID=A0A9Q0F174_9ROSI|nr:hypothetical protein Tsubulata_036887 [Turnera subulata]
MEEAIPPSHGGCPRIEVNGFKVLDVVDVFEDFTWRVGFISQVLPENTYVVHIKKKNTVKEVPCWKLRPHVFLVNGNWVSKPQLLSISPISDEQHAAGGSDEAEVIDDTDMFYPSCDEEDYLQLDDETHTLTTVEPAGACEMDMEDLPTEAGELTTMTTGKEPTGEEPNAAGDNATEMDTHEAATNVAELSTETCLSPAGPTEPLVDPEWHLVKSPHMLQLWNDVESLDGFRVIPQRPHFRPLAKCTEISREGYAIGHMITFNNLVQKATTLKIDDARSSFDKCLESLSEKGTFGFNVEPIEARLNDMLAVKDSREKLQNEARNAYAQIAEIEKEKLKLEESVQGITSEKSKLVEEVESLTEKLKILRKKLSDVKDKLRGEKPKLKKKDREIAALQGQVDAAKARILELEHEFERLAVAPM